MSKRYKFERLPVFWAMIGERLVTSDAMLAGTALVSEDDCTNGWFLHEAHIDAFDGTSMLVNRQDKLFDVIEDALLRFHYERIVEFVDERPSAEDLAYGRGDDLRDRRKARELEGV